MLNQGNIIAVMHLADSFVIIKSAVNREDLVIRDLTIRRDLRKNGEGSICTIKEPIFKLRRRSIRVKGARTLRHENIVGSFSIHRLINQTKSLVV